MPLTREGFQEPLDWNDAEERRLLLIAQIEDIDTQFGDPLKRISFPSVEDYWKWRGKAKWARTVRLQELRLVKAWIREDSFRQYELKEANA